MWSTSKAVTTDVNDSFTVATTTNVLHYIKVFTLLTKKKIATSITALALLAGVVAPAFAETTTPPPASGTASTTTSATSKIACIGAAVSTREQSIGTAESAFTIALNSAYTARANALQQAYALTSTKEVRTAVKAAWAAFSKSAKSARSDWATSRSKAWSTFKTAAAACKAPGNLSDGGNAASEVSGN